uniref:uncharacterized protein CXorf49 homolog n=1 Tax=Jaculus jaculus TaxID=51337 RepID=UPI001E1B4C05|nr:uncharacterized protein CXorf49 homolog [Jaculus jaculus]
MMDSDDAQGPSSDPESSHAFSEVQTMRVTICLKDRGQAKASGPTEPGDPPKHWSGQPRESFIPMPSVLTSSPQGLTSTSSTERQVPSREVESVSSKKKRSVDPGKGGSEPRHPGAAAATEARGTPRASPRKKAAQKKKALWETPSVTLGRTFQQWGQRLKSAAAEPATFPPISGVGLPKRAKKCSLLPLGPKQFKNCYPGKRAVAKKSKELQPAAKEERDAARGASAQAQLSTHGAEPPGLCMHEREFGGADPNSKAPQDPGKSPALALSQRGIIIRVSAPSGDQEPPLPLDLDMEPSPGVEGCSRCQELQKEIEGLQRRLAAMHALREKLQIP